MATGGGVFCSLHLNFGVCCCPSSLSCPGNPVKSSGDLVRWLQGSSGHGIAQKQWKGKKKKKKAILKRQKSPKASGPSRVLLGGAGAEGKRRQLIKALLAQELPSAN